MFDREFMAWIEGFGLAGGRRTAWCVDGYLPYQAEFEETYKKLLADDDKYIYNVDRFPRSALFAQALNRLQSGYIRKKKAGCGFCDTFVLSFGEEMPILPPLTYLYREFLADKRKDDYSLILVLPESPVGGDQCKGCLENGLADLGFTIKQKNYLDQSLFKGKCLELLEHVLEPYVAPCLIAEARVKKLGFSCSRP